MDNYRIEANKKYNSIEVYFEGKPDRDIINGLKGLKMRWNPSKGCWYGFVKGSELESILGGTVTETESAKARKGSEIEPLWVRCDVSAIREHSTRLSTKEIAKECREHLKKRFPECSFSIRIGSGGWASANCIDAYITKSPYERTGEEKTSRFNNSEEVRANNNALGAILNYCESYLQSFNYDNSDLISDYYDVNFYGNFKIDYSYTQTEATEESKKALEEYEASRAEFAKALEEKEAAEMERRIKEMEEARAKAEIIRAEEKAKAEAIENGVKVVDIAKDKHYRIKGLEGGTGKECNLDEVIDTITEGHAQHHTAEITRKVIFEDVELFNHFCNMFLYDFSFLAGFGGMSTDDTRVTDENIHCLNSRQLEEIEFYISDAVAVYLGEELRLVIDPEGYKYARYVYIPTEATEPTETTPEPAENIKELYFPEELSKQAENLKAGEVVTILNINPWTCCTDQVIGTIEGVKLGKYAQYNNSLFIEYKPAGKRTTKEIILHEGNECIIFKGALPKVPDNISRRQISENMFELCWAGAGAVDYIINAAEYYKAEGFTSLLDTIKR